MPLAQAAAAVRVLLALDKDFMVHDGAPDTHRFHYRRSGRRNPDFERRCARYRAFAAPFDDRLRPAARVGQLLAVEPPDAPSDSRCSPQSMPTRWSK